MSKTKVERMTKMQLLAAEVQDYKDLAQACANDRDNEAQLRQTLAGEFDALRTRNADTEIRCARAERAVHSLEIGNASLTAANAVLQQVFDRLIPAQKTANDIAKGLTKDLDDAMKYYSRPIVGLGGPR